MNRLFRSCVLMASIAGIGSTMLAQGSATFNGPPKNPCGESYGDQMGYTVGKPFVGTWSDTMIQMQGDGTDLAPVVSLTKMARDSSGEVYIETQILTQKEGIHFRHYWVNDPATGKFYDWSVPGTVMTVAHYASINSREMQERLGTMPWAKNLWAVPLCTTGGPGTSFDEDEFSIQNLGTDRIVGIDEEGILSKRNDGTVTEERWYSSDLQIALTTRVNDLRHGTWVREIRSLERVEPDPRLFEIPAGYEVKGFLEAKRTN